MKEWEQVPKNDKGFHTGKMKEGLQNFQGVRKGAPLITNIAQFIPKLPDSISIQKDAASR